VSPSSDADYIKARSDTAARKRFLGFLNQAVGTVCPHSHWFASPDPSGCLAALTLPDPAVRLRSAHGDLFLRSTIKFEYIDHPERSGERKVSTLFYAHTVTVSESAGELFSWQWHPFEEEPSYPHMHVTGAEAQGRTLHKLHIPTGRVFLESVLIFLIMDLGVMPIRDDWSEVLYGNLGRLAKFATWGAAGPA
jgi:hypothetical protein